MRFLRPVLVCALAAWIAAGAPARADGPAAVTAVGCLDGQPDSLRFEDQSGVYRLTGNTAPLVPYIGKAVEVVGVPFTRWLATPGRAIEVVSGAAVAGPATAPLDRALADPARWPTEIERRFGVSIAFPGARLPNLGALPRSRLPAGDEVVTLHRSALPRAIFPESDFAGGYFALFADRDISGAEQCAAASPRSGGAARFAPNTLTIAGVDYTARGEPAPPPRALARRTYLRALRNGICYEFAFVFMMADREEGGAMDCMVRSADPSRLARLIIAQVSFFPPETAAR